MLERSQAFVSGQVAAMAEEACDAGSYELALAVDVALSEPDAAARWLRGETLFRAASQSPAGAPLGREGDGGR